MDIIRSLIFGIVQGLTEFLPVSSSGHFVLLARLGLGENNLFFNVILHLGTLFAVIWFLKSDLLEIIKHPFGRQTTLVLAATLPTAVLAVVAKFLLPELIYGKYLAVGFALTSVLLVFAEIKSRRTGGLEVDMPRALLAGIFQGVAILPGISRSGATISALLASGVERERAARFSFLMSIPIIIAGAAEEALSLQTLPSSADIFAMLAGVLAAFVTGLCALRFLYALIRRRSLVPFAIYTASLAVLTLILLA